MMFLASLTVAALLQHAAAAPDPLITPIAELSPRQDKDPAQLGWVSKSGASAFSDLRSCDFPATLSQFKSFAQCCANNVPCNFFTTCSGGTVVAESTAVPCDQGICNTAIIVPTIGASGGQSFLGCWATDLGQDPFTIVADIGSAPIATTTGGSSSGASGGSSSSATRSAGSSGAATSEAASTASTAAGSRPSASPTGAGGRVRGEPIAGLLGFFTGLLALL